MATEEATVPMRLHRRTLLKASVGGGIALALTGCSMLPRKASGEPDHYAGAIGLPDGSFGVSALSVGGECQCLWHDSLASPEAPHVAQKDATYASNYVSNTSPKESPHVANQPFDDTTCASASGAGSYQPTETSDVPRPTPL